MKRTLLLILLACGTFSAIVAQTADATAIRQKVSQAAQRMKTMQCEFVQTKHLKMLNDKMVSSGKMAYQQSDRLRWEYQKPYTYTFILNGNNVALKSKDRNDVIDVRQNKLFREIARIMMNSVVGQCLDDDKNFKTALAATDKEWTATLTPLRKDMKQMFQKIILHFDKQQAIVRQVTLVEKNNDQTVIDLKNIRINEAIDAKTFAVN